MILLQKNAKKILIICLALIFSCLGLLVLGPAPKTEAATCYRDLGNFKVDPATHTCPTGATYYSISGGEYSGTFLSRNHCFVTMGTAQGGVPTYQEQSCANLESLRKTAAIAACEDSGGTWRVARPGDAGFTNDTCVCPNRTSLRTTGRCESYDPTVPTSSDSAIGEPSYVKEDCDGENIQAGADENSSSHCGILDYLVLFINILSAIVGVVVAGSIIYGGIQYSMAGGDPQKVMAAKVRIRNAIIALIFFIFTYSFLNYLVPGGVL